jgi:hypothetical protein
MRTIRQNFDLIDHIPDERLELYADDARILDSTWKYLVRHPPETVRVKIWLSDDDREVVAEQDREREYSWCDFCLIDPQGIGGAEAASWDLDERTKWKIFGAIVGGSGVLVLTLVLILKMLGVGQSAKG